MALNGAFVNIWQLLAGLIFGFCGKEWLGVISVPAPQTGLTPLENQHGSSRELSYTLENRVRRRSETIPEEKIESHRIGFRTVRGHSQDGSNLRTEPHGAVVDSVIDGLDTEWIPRDHKSPLALVPDRQ